MKNLLLSLMLFLIMPFTLWAQGQQHSHADEHNHYHRFVKKAELEQLERDTYLDVNTVRFQFRKQDTQTKTLKEFTTMDVLKLEEFFMTKEEVLACESHTLDKQVKVIINNNETGEYTFDHRSIVDALAAEGYIVIGLQRGQEQMLFKGSGNCEPIYLGEVPFSPTCSECGAVEISQEMQEKLSKEDYGGEAIQFDFAAPSTTTTIDSTFDTSDSDDEGLEDN